MNKRHIIQNDVLNTFMNYYCWCRSGEFRFSVTSASLVLLWACKAKNEPVRRLCFGLSISN